MENNIGLTKGAGWQFGIRKTMPANLETLWNIFFSDRGLSYWSEGVDQDFSTFNKYSHIRTKWRHKDFTEAANLQIRFIPSKNQDKTTISFHVDKLKNEGQREVTREYWSKVIEDLKLLLESQSQS
ncbi:MULTISPECIES: SRPBCC domain-containing protein [Sphingobacterium]|uniref:SRPBCC domain-containing protein n=1 Tax=Sphingobacterium TaxID=28453 RepID=UPI00257AD3FC|nr:MULTISPECIES: SRPBCC domain-containing protein [Sphingobacterium]